MIDARRWTRSALIVAFLSGTADAQDAASTGPTQAGSTSVREIDAAGTQVLVELYTSQGCNYCPTAERLLQEMARKGYGAGRVVPLAFHVDYFNTPWADPFSDRLYSGRQRAYHEAFKKRDPKSPDLYFTPMLMVDGRYPMSGYHSEGTGPLWPLLRARLDRALKARREAGLALRLESPPDRPSGRNLSLRATPKSARFDGKQLLACVAIAEGPLTTAVPSGENAGQALVEHHVVRTLQFRSVTLRRDEPAEADFALELAEGLDPARCHLVAFLQDEATGAIVQVASMPWNEPPRSGR